MTRMVNHDFVRTGNEPQPLKGAVVVVYNSSREAVHKHLCFTRTYMQPETDGRILPVETRRESERRVGVPRPETEVIRMVEEPASPQEGRMLNDRHAAVAAVMTVLGV